MLAAGQTQINPRFLAGDGAGVRFATGIAAFGTLQLWQFGIYDFRQRIFRRQPPPPHHKNHPFVKFRQKNIARCFIIVWRGLEKDKC